MVHFSEKIIYIYDMLGSLSFSKDEANNKISSALIDKKKKN